jgi:hypothetical protein
LLHCHMKRTSRASSHLDLCHADRSASHVVAICGCCQSEKRCWWLRFWDQVGCSSMIAYLDTSIFFSLSWVVRYISKTPNLRPLDF